MLVGAGERARGRLCLSLPNTQLAWPSEVPWKVPWWVTGDQGFYKKEQRCWFVGVYADLPSTLAKGAW